MNNTTRLVALQLIKTAQAWDPAVQARQAQAKQQAQQATDAQARAKATATGGKLEKDMTPAEMAQSRAEYKAQRRARAQASGGHNAPAGGSDWAEYGKGVWQGVKDFGNLVSLGSMRFLTGIGSGLLKLPGAVLGAAAAVPGGIAKGLWNYATTNDPNQGFFSSMGSGFKDAYNTVNDGINNFDIGGYSINSMNKSLDTMDRWAGNKYTAAVRDMTGQDPTEWNSAIRFSAGFNDKVHALGELTGAAIGGRALGRLATVAPKIAIPGRVGNAVTATVSKPISWGAAYGKTMPFYDTIDREVTNITNNGFGASSVRQAQAIKDQQMKDTNGLGINIYDYLPQSNQQTSYGTQFQQPQQNQVGRYNTFSSQGISNATYNNQSAQFGNQFGYA